MLRGVDHAAGSASDGRPHHGPCAQAAVWAIGSAAPPLCNDRRVLRLRPSLLVCALGALVPAAACASTSGARLWTALGANVTCGVAIHPPGTSPAQLLCSAKPVPPPKAKGIGDPGFVFLSSVGHPSLARLSQDSFVGTNPVALRSGSTWGGGVIGVTCTISATAVTCSNHSHHGFTITRRSYRAF